MIRIPAILLVLIAILVFSCVSKSKFERAQTTIDSLNRLQANTKTELKSCYDTTNEMAKRISVMEVKNDELSRQNNFLKENNTQAIKQLQDLSVITSTQAESIKKSLDNIGMKDTYIMDLQKEMARKDSLNMVLVMNLKGAIGNLADEDINIKIDKGVIFIDISDRLLFKSGSYVITARAKEVLGKVAVVLKNQPDLEFMVEGHTDNVPYNRAPLLDNWDLSVKRATAVVRVLQNQYGLSPAKITAAGRSEYDPVAGNNTAEGRALNRRTRIVVLPQLDQFFKLLEKK
jgi:chemotaxis protein MotB